MSRSSTRPNAIDCLVTTPPSESTQLRTTSQAGEDAVASSLTRASTGGGGTPAYPSTNSASGLTVSYGGAPALHTAPDPGTTNSDSGDREAREVTQRYKSHPPFFPTAALSLESSSSGGHLASLPASGAAVAPPPSVGASTPPPASSVPMPPPSDQGPVVTASSGAPYAPPTSLGKIRISDDNSGGGGGAAGSALRYSVAALPQAVPHRGAIPKNHAKNHF